MVTISRVPTGIPGLDGLIEGGLPRGSTTLVSGSPGTGKTTMAVQFLYNGALKYDEPGVLVLLNDRAENIKLYMSRFGWDIGELEMQGKLSIIEMTPAAIPTKEVGVVAQAVGAASKSQAGIRTRVGIFEDILPFSTETVTKIVDEKIQTIGAKRLAFDSISDLMIRHPDIFNVRLDLLWLIRYLADRQLTSILVSEVSKEGELDRFGVESFLVSGVIALRSVAMGDETLNVLEVVKMRGTQHSKRRIAYRITSTGISFLPSIRFPGM